MRAARPKDWKPCKVIPWPRQRGEFRKEMVGDGGVFERLERGEEDSCACGRAEDS